MSIISTSLLLACVLLHACSVTSESDKETCYSRQHRGVTVNIRLSLTKGMIMIPHEKPSEKDCILTCCSEDVKPGVKCNLVVYKPVEESSGENCYLFNCPSEQDCPLTSAGAGVNTYNIFRGLTHPTTKGNGRTTAKPATAENPQLTTTTPQTATITTSPTTPQPTTTTTRQTTTTSITTSAPSAESSDITEEEPTEAHVILQTTPVTSTTTTTQPTTTQSTSTSTVTKARAHQRPAVKPNRKPNKPVRGPESHSFKPTKGKIPTTHPITSFATHKPTTTAPTTTTTTTTSAVSQVTPVALLEIESKPRAVNVKPRFSRMMWKNSLVAVVVITLIFLLLILALVARKAMESFDRRHYTRLELNDLHYEV